LSLEHPLDLRQEVILSAYFNRSILHQNKVKSTHQAQVQEK